VVRVDVALSIRAEGTLCLTFILTVNVDSITVCPHFNSNQHRIDVYPMQQLQQEKMMTCKPTTKNYAFGFHP